MDSATWGECWKIIDRYASYFDPDQPESLIQNDKSSHENQQMTTQPVMGGPPISGDGSTAYSEPNPDWKEPNMLDADIGEVGALSISDQHDMQRDIENARLAKVCSQLSVPS